MRLSNFLVSTTKDTPSDAEVISHQLMLRGGFIRKLASGLYTWSPLGLRVLRKVEHIVREELNKAGALELQMPAVQPAELWQESERWEQYGPELLRFNDRHNREFCFGPTHEEVITDFARREIASYKQLPLNFYQIQTKFRDEIRPRFGIMRAREFLMKDAYSFHLDQTSLEETYQVMHATYCRIFERIGLNFRPVSADTGSIGGAVSHEFHVLAESGEDDIAFSNESDYAANVELAEALVASAPSVESGELEKISTPNAKSISDVSSQLGVSDSTCVKTLIVEGLEEAPLVALVLRGDHQLNDIKAEKLGAVKAPLTMASETAIESALGCKPGSIGPMALDIPIIVDRSAEALNSFIAGANEDGFHYRNIEWKRDVENYEVADIRNVVLGDKSPDGKGTLNIARGIEVGHIFQLGQKYSEKLNATVLDANGKSAVMTMGCYGIGVSRVVAAAVEQNNDDNGIIWPDAIAPFTVAICPLNMHKSEQVASVANALYEQLTSLGIDVVLDDRQLRAGAMFADLELIGIPHRIVVGDRALKENSVEYKGRKDADATLVKQDEIIAFINAKLG